MSNTESILANEKWYWKTIGVFFRYRFIEKKSGIFIKHYPDNYSIRINVENFGIDYKQNHHFPYHTPQKIITHKDVVVLCCVDMLLTKGYKRANLLILPQGQSHTTPDIIVLDKEKSPLLIISCYPWGQSFEKAKKDFQNGKGSCFNYYKTHKTSKFLCIFSTYLDGGLPHIDYKFVDTTETTSKKKVYYSGIFEHDIRSPTINPVGTEHERQAYLKELRKSLQEYPHIEDFSIKNGEIVKYLGNNAEITIPDPTISIGIGAFWDNNNLENVKLNEGLVRISGDAFYKCHNLKHINISSTVREIGNDPFSGCPNLIIKNLSPHFVMEDQVLYNRNKTQILHYPIQKENKHFTIPNTVEYINKHTFYNNSFLQTIILPERVKWMENNLFSGCTIRNVENHSPYFKVENGVLYNGDQSQVYSVFDHKLKKLLLPEKVQKIGKNSFFGRDKLEYLHISKNIKHIGYNPFVGCSDIVITNESPKFQISKGILIEKKRKLVRFCPRSSVDETIELPENIRVIGRNAFCLNDKLKYLTLPSSVKLIERGAFAGCRNLEHIGIPQSVTKIEKWAFSDCPKLETITIPNHTEIAEYLFNGSPTVLKKI